jgi:putative autoinducer-2 (AI-2) aldolase
MDWGMKNRISRIIKPDTGRTVMLAVDHGYFQGPTTKLENPRKTITPLLPHADALMITRGVLRTSVPPEWDGPVVLRVSGGTSMVGETLSNETLTTAFDDALRLNVAAVALSIFVGTKHEHQTLSNLAKLVDMGEQYGMPVLAVTAVGREMARDARYLGLACRIAAELGAHIVKTYYTEGFDKMVEGCPAPIVMAGGKRCDTPMDALQLTYDAISEGAVGVDMGRNIWQCDDPVPMISAVRAVVHQGMKPAEALETFNAVKCECDAEAGKDEVIY